MLKAIGLVIAAVLMVGCSNLSTSENDAVQRSQNRVPYVTRNDVEYKNYDIRQKLADDPTTILWCTSAFPVTGAPLFTVPVIGKLTSGGKRPYPSPDAIGPDGMYGPSVEYRYGFTPEGVYVDFTNIATFCTTQPTIWQKESTTLVLNTDPGLSKAQADARAALAAGDPAKAQQILEDAIKAAGGN